MVTTQVRALAAQSATSSLAPFGIQRQGPGTLDVEIDILYCGVCHSDLRQARNEWHNTVRLECVGRNPQSEGFYCGLESVRLRERRLRVAAMVYEKDHDWRTAPRLCQ